MLLTSPSPAGALSFFSVPLPVTPPLPLIISPPLSQGPFQRLAKARACYPFSLALLWFSLCKCDAQILRLL